MGSQELVAPAKRENKLTFANALYLRIKGDVSGPFTQAQVKEATKSGLASPEDSLSLGGKDGPWVKIRLTSLKKYIPSPATPAETVATVEAAKTAQPVETVKPTEATKTTQPVETVKPTEAAKTTQPVETVKPTEAAKTAQPVETAKPAEAAKIAQTEKTRQIPPKPSLHAPSASELDHTLVDMPLPAERWHPAPRAHPAEATQPRPSRRILIASLAALAILVGCTALFLWTKTSTPPGPPPKATAADFSGKTYDILMESNKLWADRRIVRLQLNPDGHIRILQSAAPADLVEAEYAHWSVENGALVFRTKENQVCDQYPDVHPKQKEFAAAPTAAGGNHWLVSP